MTLQPLAFFIWQLTRWLFSSDAICIVAAWHRLEIVFSMGWMFARMFICFVALPLNDPSTVSSAVLCIWVACFMKFFVPVRSIHHPISSTSVSRNMSAAYSILRSVIVLYRNGLAKYDVSQTPTKDWSLKLSDTSPFPISYLWWALKLEFLIQNDPQQFVHLYRFNLVHYSSHLNFNYRSLFGHHCRSISFHLLCSPSWEPHQPCLRELEHWFVSFRPFDCSALSHHDLCHLKEASSMSSPLIMNEILSWYPVAISLSFFFTILINSVL